MMSMSQLVASSHPYISNSLFRLKGVLRRFQHLFSYITVLPRLITGTSAPFILTPAIQSPNAYPTAHGSKAITFIVEAFGMTHSGSDPQPTSPRRTL